MSQLPRCACFFLATGCVSPSTSGQVEATETGPSSGEESGSESGGACEASVLVLETQRVHGEGDRFVDSAGRELWLRGVNVGGRSKLSPYFPFPFADSGRTDQSEDPNFDEALELYADRVLEWGHTLVRVPFTWEAVESQRGAYDQVFLGRYRQMLEAFGARGIRVIVDFHQDVFSRYFCGDGFPAWAVLDPPADYPSIEDCEFWSTGYFANPEVNASFDRFWANDDGLQDDFLLMWVEVVNQTAPLDFVVGYELINEPHFGSEAESDWVQGTLPDFYEHSVDALRASAPDAMWFFGLGALDGVDGTTNLRALEGEGWAFAPHYYDQQVFLSGPDDTDADAYAGISPWEAQGLSWSRPVVLGEFGVKTSFAGSPAWITQNYDALDRARMSGTVWEYSATMDDWNNEGFGLVGYGGVESPSADAVVRVYPAAVAGRVDSFVFDPETLDAELLWQADADGLTELVLPTRLYGGDVQVDLEGVEGCWAIDGLAQRVYVRTLEAGAASLKLAAL